MLQARCLLHEWLQHPRQLGWQWTREDETERAKARGRGRGGERERRGQNTKYHRLSTEDKKQMKEGKVIKIMRWQRTELVGVVQSARRAVFQRCALSSFGLSMCFWASQLCRSIHQPEAAITSLSLLSMWFNWIRKSLRSSFSGLTFGAFSSFWCHWSAPRLSLNSVLTGVIRSCR